MMTLRRLALALAAVATLMTVTTRAQENTDLSVGLKLDFVSKYMWRGAVWTDDAIVVPSLTLGYGGFALEVLGIVDTTDANGREDNFEEARYTGSYSHDLDENLTVSVGAIYYDYPGSRADSDAEAFVKAAYHTTLNPELAVYYDFKEADGWYISLGGSHEISLASVHENLALILDASIGWGSSDWVEYYLGEDESALVNVSPGATLKYTASEALSFSWYARYDYLLDSHVRDAQEVIGADSSNFSFGANVAYNF